MFDPGDAVDLPGGGHYQKGPARRALVVSVHPFLGLLIPYKLEVLVLAGLQHRSILGDPIYAFGAGEAG